MYLLIKNIIEKIIALIILILFIPVFIIIIICLKLSKIKKVIFIQERTGKNGKIFKIFKFRTINENNEITNFCKFLRKTGLDETPQIINILKGDMSFIGPRPWILDYSKYYTKEQFDRLKVKPGITGYSQVNHNNNILETIESDIYYVNNFNFILDLKILIKTFKLIFSYKKYEAMDTDIKKEIEILKKNKQKRK